MSENRYSVFSRKKTDQPLETENRTLYEKIGGAAVVGQAVDVFYRRVMRDARINYFFFGVNVTEQAEKQKAFLSMVFGGPHQYTGRDMRHSHSKLLAMGMNDRHFNIVLDHLEAALTELGVEQGLVEAVLAIAESTREDVMGRRAANPPAAARDVLRPDAPPVLRKEGGLMTAPPRHTDAKAQGHPRGTVGSIMSGRVITIHPEASIQDAISVFAQSELQSIAVVNAQGQLVGQLTANDVLKASLG